MRIILLFLVAGLCEISGGYLVWLWLRDHRSWWMGVAGFVVLAVYGVIPTFQPIEHPFGRVYAAYGAVFVLLSMLWGWRVDGARPDARDYFGVLLTLAGTGIMMWPRSSSLQS
jgi:small multidrug resistance family-3 protein